MIAAEIKRLQTRLGVEPDAVWGSKSKTAADRRLRSLMPAPNPWPATDQTSLTAFYGRPGDESRLARIDVRGLGVEYGGEPVSVIRANAECAESLRRILVKLSSGPYAYLLKEYEGCFNNRPMRGGSTPSLHSRGAAIDFDAGNNGNATRWPDQATMPFEVMEIFAAEGWRSAGAAWGRDAMHFQATR